MKVKDLLAVLQTADPEAEVVGADGPDHSYTTFDRATTKTVGMVHHPRQRPEREYYEWHGPEHASPNEKPVSVLVLS